MKTSNFLLSNSAGEKSVTTTAFLVGFVVATIKFLFSGLTILGFAIPVFTGADYSFALAALGGIYVLNKKFTNTSSGNSEEKPNV